jgi:hypothetical protein
MQNPLPISSRVSASLVPPDRACPPIAGRLRSARSLGVVLLFATIGCLTGMRSTSGGRRESRRECLHAARDAGWRVIDIGDAEFKGAARYEVTLVVEKDSVPRQSLRCAYDSRFGRSELARPVSAKPSD